MLLLADIVVLLGSSVSCSSLFFNISNADVTGIDVNKGDALQEVMHSPSSSLVFFMSSTNSLELFRWWMVLPVRVLRILVNSLATSYVTEPLLETMGPRRVFFLCIFGSPYSFDELGPVGYIFLLVVSSIPDSVLILLKMLISLSFCFHPLISC